MDIFPVVLPPFNKLKNLHSNNLYTCFNTYIPLNKPTSNKNAKITKNQQTLKNAFFLKVADLSFQPNLCLWKGGNYFEPQQIAFNNKPEKNFFHHYLDIVPKLLVAVIFHIHQFKIYRFW